MVVVVKYRHRAILLLFRDISLKFSPAESEDVVQYLKKIYGDQFKPLGNQDLLSVYRFWHRGRDRHRIATCTQNWKTQEQQWKWQPYNYIFSGFPLLNTGTLSFFVCCRNFFLLFTSFFFLCSCVSVYLTLTKSFINNLNKAAQSLQPSMVIMGSLYSPYL